MGVFPLVDAKTFQGVPQIEDIQSCDRADGIKLLQLRRLLYVILLGLLFTPYPQQQNAANRPAPNLLSKYLIRGKYRLDH